MKGAGAAPAMGATVTVAVRLNHVRSRRNPLRRRRPAHCLQKAGRIVTVGCSAFLIGGAWTAYVPAFPNGSIRLLMRVSGEILDLAPGIMRTYGRLFLLLPFNVFSIYYF